MAKDDNYVSPWGESGPLVKEQKDSPNYKGWVIGILIFLVLGGGAVYYFFLRSQPGPNVGVTVSKPNQVMLGDPFTVNVSLTNYSDMVLKNSKLSVFLPDGVYFTGESLGQRVTEEDIGDIGPGSVNQAPSFNLIVASGTQGVVKTITAKLVYQSGSNTTAQYETDGEVDFAVGEPALGLTLTAPPSVYGGSEVNIQVSYVNSTGHDVNGVKLKIDYPASFGYERSTVSPEANTTNVWDLGTVAAGASQMFTIVGTLSGPGNSSFDFVGTLTAPASGVIYTVNSETASVAIQQTPLDLKIAVNNSSNYVASLGDALNYVLSYTNNFSVALNNLTIVVKLTGDMFDFSGLQTGGYFNSAENSITWLVSNTPSLASLAPGGTGSVTFSIKAAKSFPIRLLSDKNFTLGVQVTAQSPTVPPGTAAQKTVAMTNLETKVAGAIQVMAKAFWRDAVSGILNSGPYPPRVNQPTDYTVHWYVTNYGTDVSNVQVSAYLQSGSKFTGQVKSNVLSSTPAYDPSTGLVAWTISSLPATKGVVSPPAEAVFQIENTPNSNQVGQSVQLLSQTSIQAQDLFTGVTLQGSAQSLDTGLPYDTTISGYNRQVQP